MVNRDYKVEFQMCEEKISEITELKGLFKLWKEAQDIEIDEIENIIGEYQKNGRSEGDIFEHNLYKVRGKKNQNTISSHFVQFFYKNCPDSCSNKPDIGKEKIWKFVLKNAFNLDGCVGKLNVRNNGYKYIFLLKEANDSAKGCLKNYDSFSIEDKNVNIWVQEWKNGESADMLDKLYGAMKDYLVKNDMTKEEFLSLAAYMNINKRGGAVQTLGYDQTAVINYAERYRKFILKQICLLSSDNTEIIVFVAGKNNKYFVSLMRALGVENLLEYEDKDSGKRIKFFNITHPSKPGTSSKKLAEEMENEGLKDNLTSTLGLLSKGFSLA